MKKHFIQTLPGMLFLLLLSSCFHNHNVTSISISEDEDEYEMDASYRKSKTHQVRVYLNENLLDNSTVLVKNKPVKKEITLDDNTSFYLDAHPGELRIKIDKSDNSEASCKKIRLVCEGLKEILEDN